MSHEVSVSVMIRGPVRHNMCGQSLPPNLYDVEGGTISHGLVARLHAYGVKTLSAEGFDVAGWPSEVSTLDGDAPPSERFYSVKFLNEKGGAIGVEGIMTRQGHPFLDHGIFVRRVGE